MPGGLLHDPPAWVLEKVATLPELLETCAYPSGRLHTPTIFTTQNLDQQSQITDSLQHCFSSNSEVDTTEEKCNEISNNLSIDHIKHFSRRQAAHMIIIILKQLLNESSVT